MTAIKIVRAPVLNVNLITFLLVFLWFYHLKGQPMRDYDKEMQEKHAKIKGYDPQYRVNYFENIILKSFITSNESNFQFRSLANNEVIDLIPAGQYLLGLSLDYKWIAVEASFSPDFLQSNVVQNSTATSYSVSLNFFYSDQWRQELRLLYNQGFVNRNHDSNSLIIDQNLLNSTTLTMLQGSTFYIANNNFSYRAHYAQTERQLKSTGSFIPTLRYAYSVINPNLPPQSTGNATDFESVDITAQLGYLHTFVTSQKWYLTLGVFAGLGYNYAAYEVTNGNNLTFNNTIFAVEPEFGMGYNDYRWFFGFSGNWRNFNHTNNEAGQFSRQQAYFLMHFGYRFNDNKPMRQFFGWFEEHLGF